MMENLATCNLVQVVVSVFLQLIMSPKRANFPLPGISLKNSQRNLVLALRCALPGSAVPVMFDSKTGIDLQFTGLCLIKGNTATLVNCQSYQSPVKSFPVTSRLRGAVIPMHPARRWGRVSESSGLCCFFRRRSP